MFTKENIFGKGAENTGFAIDNFMDLGNVK